MSEAVFKSDRPTWGPLPLTDKIEAVGASKLHHQSPLCCGIVNTCQFPLRRLLFATPNTSSSDWRGYVAVTSPTSPPIPGAPTPVAVVVATSSPPIAAPDELGIARNENLWSHQIRVLQRFFWITRSTYASRLSRRMHTAVFSSSALPVAFEFNFKIGRERWNREGSDAGVQFE